MILQQNINIPKYNRAGGGGGFTQALYIGKLLVVKTYCRFMPYVSK